MKYLMKSKIFTESKNYINKFEKLKINQYKNELFFAIEIYDVGMVELLITAGVDLDITDIKGNTALILVADYHNSEYQIEMIKLLIDNGADWNIKNVYKDDFLDKLYNNGNEKIKNIIIELYPEKYEEYLMKKNAEKYNL